MSLHPTQTFRVITWNVYFGNKKIRKLLTFALSHNADVVCLQEVPQKVLPILKTFTEYNLAYCYDFSSRHNNKNVYICTLTRQKPLAVEKTVYNHKDSLSLINTVWYKRLLHNTEHHISLIVRVNTPLGVLQIVNIRLSCAVGTNDRIGEFKTLLSHVSYSVIPTIFCGDFNVIDSHWFNRITGWLRGFTPYDYKTDEREEFESIFHNASLINIFYGHPTMFFKKPLLQLDHILIPNTQTVIHKEIIKKRFGSDHRMLLTDIA